MKYYAILDWTTRQLIHILEGTPKDAVMLFDSEEKANECARDNLQYPWSIIEVPEEALIYLNHE